MANGNRDPDPDTDPNRSSTGSSARSIRVNNTVAHISAPGDTVPVDVILREGGYPPWRYKLYEYETPPPRRKGERIDGSLELCAGEQLTGDVHLGIHDAFVALPPPAER